MVFTMISLMKVFGSFEVMISTALADMSIDHIERDGQGTEVPAESLFLKKAVTGLIIYGLVCNSNCKKNSVLYIG